MKKEMARTVEMRYRRRGGGMAPVMNGAQERVSRDIEGCIALPGQGNDSKRDEEKKDRRSDGWWY
jgi:hypothetical protein